MQTTTQHGQWSSRLAFILATTGAAVGLGNIWKFPYMAGSNGGSAFILMYLLFIVLIGIPIMIAEILIGRQARQNVVSSLKHLAEQSKHTVAWGYLGWWGAITLIITLSFYSVVASWSLAYAYYALIGKIQSLDAEGVQQLWQHFAQSPLTLMGWHTLFMGLNFWIVRRGVNRGLEQASRFMMPALLLILIALALYASYTADFKSAWEFLFYFHPQSITTAVVISAMGHAFFTLAIGAGCLLTYGCYLKSHVSILGAVATVAFLDVIVALLAGMAIFPIIFQNHLSVQEGPTLMFQVLPIAFAHIPAGLWVGFAFFVLMLFAALTSTISLAEPPVIVLMEQCRVSRTRATLLVSFISWFLGIGSVLSFNRWQHFTWLDRHFFELSLDLVTNILLPIGGLGFCLFAGWILPKKMSRQAFHPTHTWVHHIWRVLIRYITPLGILIVLLGSH